VRRLRSIWADFVNQNKAAENNIARRNACRAYEAAAAAPPKRPMKARLRRQARHHGHCRLI